MRKNRIFEILKYTYGSLKENLYPIFEKYYDNIEEIRIRAFKPVIVQTSESVLELKSSDGSPYIMTDKEVQKLFANLCENSIYAYINEIRNGYITVSGGHRVGIAGRAVCKNDVIKNITDISSLNIRIASERIGAGDEVMKHILNKGFLKSTIIFAPPMVGKTTVLRDVARQISNVGFKVGITDDRGEIAGMYRGVPQNDIGKFSDVIENAPKDKAINMLIRSMSPDVIITDEISNLEDMRAVLSAVGTGVKVIATTHGSDFCEVAQRAIIRPLISCGEFAQLLEIKRKKNNIDVIKFSLSNKQKDVIAL